MWRGATCWLAGRTLCTVLKAILKILEMQPLQPSLSAPFRRQPVQQHHDRLVRVLRHKPIAIADQMDGQIALLEHPSDGGLQIGEVPRQRLIWHDGTPLLEQLPLEPIPLRLKLRCGYRQENRFSFLPRGRPRARADIRLIILEHLRDLVSQGKAHALARGLAREGYVAIVPDISKGSSQCGRPDGWDSANGIERNIRHGASKNFRQDLMAVVAHIADHPASNGKVALVGVGWAGRQIVRFALENPQEQATLTFDAEPANALQATANIECAVYGYYRPDLSRSDSAAATVFHCPEGDAGSEVIRPRVKEAPQCDPSAQKENELTRVLGLLDDL